VSRHLALHDRATVKNLTLIGVTAFFVNESKGDEMVMLSDPA